MTSGDQNPETHHCLSWRFARRVSEAWQVELQSASHNHCTTPGLRACWDVDVLKTYIVTSEYVALPVKWQDAMIEFVRDDTWSVEHIASSRLPFLSPTDKFTDILERIVWSIVVALIWENHVLSAFVAGR